MRHGWSSVWGPVGWDLKPRAEMLVFLAVWGGWQAWIYPFFFPGHGGGMGHDYAFFLPQLLDNATWMRANGWWSTFWFTPAFCSGIPAFGDPQNLYYSLPQMLSLWVTPQRAVYITVTVMALLGFWGMRSFLRGTLGLHSGVALSGAILFMCNTFFLSRMVVGHLGFHGVMLLPWAAYVLFTAFDAPSGRGELARVGAAGAIGAYWVHSGMLVLLVPAILALVGLLGVALLSGRAADLRVLVRRFGLSACLCAALSASKLVAVISFLGNYPRTLYPLPGFPSLGGQGVLLLRNLFFWPPQDMDRYPVQLVNVQWRLDYHEWLYGISVLPLMLLLWCFYQWVRRVAWDSGERTGSASREAVAPARPYQSRAGAALLLTAVLIPLAVNWYTPGWNAWLKSLPGIGTSSNLVRWWVVFTVLSAPAALALARNGVWVSEKPGILIVLSIMTVGVQYAGTDWNFFRSEFYRPSVINDAWEAGRAQKLSISGNGYSVENGRIVAPFDRNEMAFKTGESAMFCNNPVFGYTLETLPMEGLEKGPALKVIDGHFNFRNPACALFPESNPCEMGGLFPLDKTDDLEALLSYRPFPFHKSALQTIADGLSAMGVAILVLIAAGLAASALWNRGGGR